MKQHLKQRLLGATVLVSLAVIFLPIIFDGGGYRQLSKVEVDVPEQPHISFEQNFPELPERTPKMVITREQVEIGDSPADEVWFVHVADRDSRAGAAELVKRLNGRGYRASYRPASAEDGGAFKVEVNAGADKAAAGKIAARIEREYGLKTSLIRR